MSKFNYYISGDYKRYLKKNGAADCSVKDALRVKPDPNVNRQRNESAKKRILERCMNDNVNHELVNFMKKFAVKKVR